ncbi:hypothetical protein [Methylomonas rapida]|uniref:Uncharacterized protein n=1 Tax=Methylomonas rapida TaxID=2963939 RepID=A0ABY7GF21_9GAMM|nr:hypothetical protein [Methylomonas rapida]WAR43882.1 hypothetical protein NM686_016105 [Methylomonas rapida]
MAPKSKLPPFGTILVERQRFKNPPWLVVVCVGAGAWQSAKIRNGRGDSVGLVLPPGENPASFNWPIQGCKCVVEWSVGPSVDDVVELVKALLRSGAELVAVNPIWQNGVANTGEPREVVRIYRAKREAGHVAR